MEEMQKKLQTEADTLRQIHKGKETFVILCFLFFFFYCS